MLDRGAFGEASMYAPQFGLVSADTCINPGTVQVPPPAILSPSQFSSNSDGDTEQGASHELVRPLVSRFMAAWALTIQDRGTCLFSPFRAFLLAVEGGAVRAQEYTAQLRLGG
jgi:hypothetical protein